jgi:ATPases with chaperone activity, ATP-binding subunit
MRADVKRDENGGLLFGLLYLVAHVLALGLGFFFGHYLFDKPIYTKSLIDLLLLFPLYVVILYANIFVAAGLDAVFKLSRRLNAFVDAFLSYLLLFSSFLFLVFLFSGWKGLLNLGTYVLIYFILPLGLSLFVMNLIGKAMGYSFGPEEKAMVKGGQSEADSSAKHREVKADKPIVWNFADYGKRVVVGQDHAIDTIQKVLVANSKLADLGNPRRQRILASFFFVGPTGVGKTETAKALAVWLEDYGYSYLRIDASQFSDREAVWTLLGSPKGYVGSDRPGLLPHAISQNPKQVILIDEIEKADQGFYQFLLQMLDEAM